MSDRESPESLLRAAAVIDGITIAEAVPTPAPAPRIVNNPSYPIIASNRFDWLYWGDARAGWNWEHYPPGSETCEKLFADAIKPLLDVTGTKEAIVCAVHNSGQVTAVKRYNTCYNQALKIYSYAYPVDMIFPGGVHGTQIQRLMFGETNYDLSGGRRDCFDVEGNMLDNLGVSFAHYDADKKAIYIFFDMFHENIAHVKHLLFAMFLNMAEQIKNPGMNHISLEKAFCARYDDESLHRLPELRTEISQISREVDGCLDSYRVTLRRLEDSKREFGYLTEAMAKRDSTFSPYQAIIEKMHKTGKWQLTRCTARYFLVESVSEIAITLNGIRVPIGKFQIQIPWSSHTGNSQIKITNITRVIESNYHHPHVKTSSICWGNIGQTVTELWAKREYFVLLELIHDYLQGYTAHDCYLSIDKWITDTETLKKIGLRCETCKKHPFECRCPRCTSCGELVARCACGAGGRARTTEAVCHSCGESLSNCECDRCENCEELVDDCECRRCPSSGELIPDDDYCDGCDNRDEDGNCQY